MRKLNINKQGFTLMELMVMIGIMAIIMSAAAFDYVKQAPKRKVTGAAFDIMTFFRQARMMAASCNAPAEVSINDHTMTIWVDKNMDGTRDNGEITQKTIEASINLTTWPAFGTFDSRGMFSSSGSYMYMYMYTDGALGQTVYVFPSGHIDLYYY